MNITLTESETNLIEDLLCAELRTIIQNGEKKGISTVDDINSILVKINKEREEVNQ